MDKQIQGAQPHISINGSQPKLPLLGYGLMLLGLIYPSVLLLAILWLFINRKNVDEFIICHRRYQIRTFVIALILFAISLLLNQFAIGYLLIFPVWFWCLYRVLIGTCYCFLNKPVK